MRITRRTSGGRGEYEISEESPEGYSPGDLLDRQIILAFPGGWQVNTALVLAAQGGKRRLRRAGAQIQVQRQIAAALLLPMPVRADEALGAGAPVVQSDRYAIDHILVDSVELTTAQAVLHLSDLILRNASAGAEEISLSDRVAQLEQLWAQASQFPDSVSRLLRNHEQLVRSGAQIRPLAEKLVEQLQAQVSDGSVDLGVLYSQQTDVLPALRAALALEVPEPALRVDEVDPAEAEVRRRTVKEWKRWANARGPKSAIFRQMVRRAYRSTCVLCGSRFPATPFSSTGIDAAHILPWSDYDLDEVRNGLSLCKLHHWAFDEALLVVNYEGGGYVAEIPSDVDVKLEQLGESFTREPLQQVVGRIPDERLPPLKKEWPAPDFLNALNFAQEPPG